MKHKFLLFCAALMLCATALEAQIITTVAGGNGPGFGANQLNHPFGIFVDGSGNIYATDLYNDRIQKFPAGSTSATNGVTAAGGNGNAGGATQFRAPFQTYVDGLGNLYVADQNNFRIQQFPAGSTSTTPGVTVAGGNGQGSAPNQFQYPRGLYLDSSGNIYVADLANDFVKKFPAGSTSATNGVIAAGGNGAGSAVNQLNTPTSLYVDGSGNIYVTDQANNRIQKFAAGSTQATNGLTVAGGNGAGSAANQLSNPNGVFVDGSGNIYVSDEDNNRIQKFPAGSTSATNGVTVAGGNGAGSAANQLDAPAGVYVDGSGNIFVSDQNNHRIQMYSAICNRSTIINQGIAAGTFYSAGGHIYTASGTYTINLGGAACYGCDSIITLNLTVAAQANTTCPPTVSISANSTNLDMQSNRILTATTTNAGTKPYFNWYRNGALIANIHGSTLSYGGALGNGDQMYATLSTTAAVTCGSSYPAGQTAASNVVTFTKSGSTANDITTLTMPNQVGASVINTCAATVSVTVTTPPLARTAIHPTRLYISPGATYGPSYAVNRDFSQPVTYTVVSQNGSSKLWMVTVLDQSGHKTSEPSTNSSAAISTKVVATDIFVYPNPATSYLMLQAQGGAESPVITILDLEGRVMYHQQLPASDMVNHMIDLSDFAGGNYIVYMTQGSKMQSSRLVVKK